MSAFNSLVVTSPAVASAFAALAVDGDIYAGTAYDKIMMELFYLKVIQRDETNQLLRYTAAPELAELLEPYRVLIARYKQVRTDWMAAPSADAAELLRYLAQQIGYPLAESWKRDLIRRKKLAERKRDQS